MHYTANMRSVRHCTKRLGSLSLVCIGFAQIVVGFQRIGLGVELASPHLKFKPFSIRSLERLMNFFIYLFFPPTLAQLGMFRKAVPQFVRSCSSPAGAAVVIFHFNFASLSSNHLRPCNKTNGALFRLLEKERTLAIGGSEQGKTLL